MMHETHKFDRITYSGCIEKHDFGSAKLFLFILLVILAVVCFVFLSWFSKRKLKAVKEKNERYTLLYA